MTQPGHVINFTFDKTTSGVEPELNYILSLWAKNANTSIAFTTKSQSSITIGFNDQSFFPISQELSLCFDRPLKLNEKGFIELPNGKPDFITTAFYLVNSLQEYHSDKPDALGRFQYKESYQFRDNSADSNLVQICFNEISKQLGVSIRSEKTKFFLTHDIDMINGALLEDGFHVIKKGRFDLFLKFLFHVAIGKPDWLNIDQIIALESSYDCKSVFYWIVNQGIINERERNADYDFKSKKIRKAFAQVDQQGFENGIHKSISSESFQEEIQKYGSLPVGNRYHYLKFNLPTGYNNIEKANLKLDASLGFAEQIGFRNNYGLPFQPYCAEEKRPYNFIEVPLHIMDRTFYQYKKSSVASAEKEIFEFLEKNRSNCVLSVLWHNNFFTNYKFKGYLDLYKKILVYIKENNFRTITQREIIEQYSLT